MGYLAIHAGSPSWAGPPLPPRHPTCPPHCALNPGSPPPRNQHPQTHALASERDGFKKHPLLTPAPGKQSNKEPLGHGKEGAFELWFQSPAPTQPQGCSKACRGHCVRSCKWILHRALTFHQGKSFIHPTFLPAESLEQESNQVFKLVSSPLLRGSGCEAVSCWLMASGRLSRDTTHLPWQHC